MKTVYVAASLSLLSQAQEVAASLRDHGFRVNASWLGQQPSIEGERRLSDHDLARIGTQCLREVEDADALVLVVGPNPAGRIGSYIEARHARTLGRSVFALSLPDALWCPMSIATVTARYGSMVEVLHALRELREIA